jgi:hypothetical protein
MWRRHPPHVCPGLRQCSASEDTDLGHSTEPNHAPFGNASCAKSAALLAAIKSSLWRDCRFENHRRLCDPTRNRTLCFDINRHGDVRDCSFVVGWTGEITVQYEGEARQPVGAALAHYQEVYFARWPESLDGLRNQASLTMSAVSSAFRSSVPLRC